MIMLVYPCYLIHCHMKEVDQFSEPVDDCDTVVSPGSILRIVGKITDFLDRPFCCIFGNIQVVSTKWKTLVWFINLQLVNGQCKPCLACMTCIAGHALPMWKSSNISHEHSLTKRYRCGPSDSLFRNRWTFILRTQGQISPRCAVASRIAASLALMSRLYPLSARASTTKSSLRYHIWR